MPESSVASPSPALVAIISWLVPGSGYVLMGQRTRGVTIGISIIALFIFGLLIAGVRVLEVPGYDAQGEKIMVKLGIDRATGSVVNRWIMTVTPLAEIRNKPWSVPQVLAGPISIAAAAWSVFEAGPDENDPGKSRGALSHSRVNEIGSLYLSVAGLLNLMTIIDVSHRAFAARDRR